MAAPPLPPPRPLWLTTVDGWSLHLACYSPPDSAGGVDAGGVRGMGGMDGVRGTSGMDGVRSMGGVRGMGGVHDTGGMGGVRSRGGSGGAGRARAAILLAPGMMLDGRAMDRPPGRGLASFFRRRGYAVYSLDLRGHGESRPRAARGVDWSFDDLVAVDIPLALSAVKARHPGLPLVWLGHSLSAHAGAAAVGRRPDLPADLLVLLCPGAWIRPLEPSWPLWQGKRAALWLWDRVTALCGRFPAARLGIGTNDESRSYVRQHREWAAAGRWQSRDGSADYLAALAGIRQPSLVVAAAGDWLCRPPSVRLLAAAIAPATPGTVELWEVSGRDLGRWRHPGHMDVLTAPLAGRLWERVDEWIGRQLGGASRRAGAKLG